MSDMITQLQLLANRSMGVPDECVLNDRLLSAIREVRHGMMNNAESQVIQAPGSGEGTILPDYRHLGGALDSRWGRSTPFADRNKGKRENSKRVGESTKTGLD